MKMSKFFKDIICFKKHKYLIMEVIFLLVITSIPVILKSYINEVLTNDIDSIYLVILIDMVFLSIYIFRYFFRPTYEDIVELRKMNWKISGYYSKYSLENPTLYYKSYSRFVRYNLMMLSSLIIITIIFYLIIGKIEKNILFLNLIIALLIQVIVWVITYILEYIESRKINEKQ